jgi:membrane protein required for colicin V production
MDAIPLNPLDLVALGILLISALIAFFRGFVHEVLSIVAWIGAALAALYGLPYLQPWTRSWIPVTWAADAAAAAAIFLGVLLVLALVTRALSKQVQDSPLNALDRSLGVLFGLARGAFVVAVAFVVLSWMFPVAEKRPDWIREARALPLMEGGAQLVRSLVPEGVLDDREKQVRAAATEAEDKARQAVVDQAFKRLVQPRPEAAKPANDTAAPRYDAEQRDDMQRLIESQMGQ